MTVKSVIELKDIVLRYGTYTAVDGVSVAFREGEFFALLGPSGCGKTSLLRMMAGFVEPTSGDMLLDGKDLAAIPARKRPVNMMFQSYALFPHMTVEANIRYGLEIAGIERDEAARRLAEMLDKTHLAPMARRKPHQLSGGQRQRVALARALVMRPRVLLLDEPLGALDKKLRDSMQMELKRLQHEMGITFIVVTHDQEEAMVMADRVALMRAGQIEQIGTPVELYENPASRFAADFVGRTNFFEGRSEGGRIVVPGLGALTSGSDATGIVHYSIRPERIAASQVRPAQAENAFEGQIEEIAYHGQDQAVHVRLAQHAEAVVVRLPAGHPEASHVQVGNRIWLSWDGRDARVLTR